MRLINSTTLKLHEIVDNQTPPYAILSHTWGEEEVSFQDLQANVPGVTENKGFEKIRQCCRIAAGDGFEYTWIDTCCIDKTSSAELSEAINSMFRWYQRAEVCYAFLADVTSDEDPQMEGSAFRRSRWFTRGWTLQELIAPAQVIFLGSDWEEIGTKLSLMILVSGITGIGLEALDGNLGLNCWSAAQKMSWASYRITTREEDTAYCLMGIFNINMPMLYGEGGRAFMRLQEEIIRSSQDESIFAWWSGERQFALNEDNRGLLASGPHQFARSGDVLNLRSPENLDSTQTFTLVCDFIELRFPMIDIAGEVRENNFWDNYHVKEGCEGMYEPGTQLAMLNCCDNSSSSQKLALCLTPSGEGNNYQRIETNLRHFIAVGDPRIDTTNRICMRKIQMGDFDDCFFRNEALAFWIRVVDSQKRQLDITTFHTSCPLGARTGLAEGVLLPEGVVESYPMLGFRFSSTTDIAFLVLMKLVYGKFVEIVEVVDESDSRKISETLDSFAYWCRRTDRVAKDVPSLGSLTVKLKRVGPTWSPVPWIQGGLAYSKIKLFCLGSQEELVERTVTSQSLLSLEQLPDRRYLIDVVLK